MNQKRGSFTIPGEEGYDELTLMLAKTWGADAIRDCDGTNLSESVMNEGMDIYSTICLIREDNEWAKKNQDKLQQCILMSNPITACSDELEIELLNGYFDQQFRINDRPESIYQWQVYDRTINQEVSWDSSDYHEGKVLLRGTKPNHQYTVNFFAYRIWEEISMYNHLTNQWGEKEHKLPIDPIYPECQKQIKVMLDKWLTEHSNTNIVRFTSLFYNFTWIWGDGSRQNTVYGDPNGYDFTVSPFALRLFEEEKGYSLSTEDFVNGGNYNYSQRIPTQKYLDWMDFINKFVVEFGKECVDMVHSAGKKAYLFYNDSWIGTEPNGNRFSQFGFDGIIEGIFNGYELRKTAEVKSVTTHEIRLHPYFFPVGVNGQPSFLPEGDPTTECSEYWTQIRRALLRKPIERIGFGGYLHLVAQHPRFIDYVRQLAEEFRSIKNLHMHDRPKTAPIKVWVVNSWGNLRSWICCGHFERKNNYNELLEALSGMPLEVEFKSFDEVIKYGVNQSCDVIINAGQNGNAWSGNYFWKNESLLSQLENWICKGGLLIRLGQLTDDEQNTLIDMTVETKIIGKGQILYYQNYQCCPEVNHKFLETILIKTNNQTFLNYYVSKNPYIDLAVFEKIRKMVFVNNSKEQQQTIIIQDGQEIKIALNSLEIKILDF